VIVVTAAGLFLSLDERRPITRSRGRRRPGMEAEMNELTYPGDVPAHGDWSQVYTGLGWVARWMADRGYSDAEISYVVGGGPSAVPYVNVATTPEPVEVPTPASVVAEQTAWRPHGESLEPRTA
jgi:hypothetical protein